MRGKDDEETMLTVVELGNEVTVEDICYEGNYLCCCCFFTRTWYRVFILWYEYLLFAYFTKGMRG
jgi:hypothetical protein